MEPDSARVSRGETARERAHRNEPQLCPNEPSEPPSIPVDVEIAPEKTERVSVLRVSEGDLEVLRRLVLAAPAPKTPVPESRPSMPVRAAKATGKGAVITSAVVGAITLLGALDPDVVRTLVAWARVVGEIAAAVRAGLGG